MTRREYVIWEMLYVRMIAWRTDAVAAVAFEAQGRDSPLSEWHKLSPEYYVNDEDAEGFITALRTLRP